MGPEIRRAATERVPLHRRYLPIPRPDEPRFGGLYDGEPETCRRSLRRFAPIYAHLGVMTLVFGVYRLEGRAFLMLATLVLGALPLHYALPYRWKKPLFAALSAVGLVLVFGATAAAVVLAASVVLIGLGRLPIPWIARAGLIAAAMGVLALGRAGRLFTEVPETAWPVLGSMFMFRILLYLYELKHTDRREPLVDAVSYFFLLPNFCFVPIFPVVDYRALQRGYFAREVHATQQDGLRMMFRGMVQLLLYRIVYHQMVISPERVEGIGSLLQFLLSNYFRYLHVSGQFHLAVGMLGLFGFSLPETHHQYFLASSFTDYWRRINIYWKDFMVRLVFNPVAFKLKRRPQWQTLAAATTAVFFATWLLHAYQSFWITGSWGFSAQDGLFWGILGVLVLVNVQLDARKPRKRLATTTGRAGDARRELAARCLKTAATFCTITVLWSLWTASSVGAWLAMWRRAF